VIVAHVLGLPVEESVLQLAPAGAAIVTAVTIAARKTFDRLRPSGASSNRLHVRDQHSVDQRVHEEPGRVGG
jgi:hypothetical protein